MSHPYFNLIEECADCGERALIADTDPSDLLVEDGSLLLRLPVPTPETLDLALRISLAVREGRASAPLEKLIHNLTAGLIASIEILSRLTLYGVEGTGDDKADDADFERALHTAHDYLRVVGGLWHPDEAPITEVQIDGSNFMCMIDPDYEFSDLPGVTVCSPSTPIEA